jgi:hypothetical protein
MVENTGSPGVMMRGAVKACHSERKEKGILQQQNGSVGNMTPLAAAHFHGSTFGFHPFFEFLSTVT